MRGRTHAIVVALMLALLLPDAARAQGAPAQDAPDVQLLPLLPPLWHSGDTHAHIQLCAETIVPDMPVADLWQVQKADELEVTCLQVWGKCAGGVPEFIASYAPLVTGQEQPVSVPDPASIVQVGVEVSDFRASPFGHAHGWNLLTGVFPYDAAYPEPILDAFRAQPGAVTGYAHVFWPQSYDLADVVFFTVDHSLHVFYATPIDVALGKVDVLETVDVSGDPPVDWKGIYYKLLNAGLRPSLVSGRDNSCAPPWDDRTFARLDAEPLTFAGWTKALKLGRTSVAEGRQFVGVTVNGEPIGSIIYLPQPGAVSVSVTYATAEPHAGKLRMLLDGVALPGFSAYDLQAGETVTLSGEMYFGKSGWIAAQAADGGGQDAHTGPVYVIVGMQPICSALDAGYWSDYTVALDGNLHAMVTAGMVDLGPADEAALHARIAEARKVFEALRSCDLPLPQGVARYGLATPSCRGPIQIGAQGVPLGGGAGFVLTCINAPPQASGSLVAGLAAPAGPAPLFKKAKLWLDPGLIIAVLPVAATAGGYHELPIAFPAAAQGVTLHFQYFWQNLPDCASSSSGVSASDALAVTVQ
jgi:hypothetical protein